MKTRFPALIFFLAIYSCNEDTGMGNTSSEVSMNRLVGVWVDEEEDGEFVEEWTDNGEIGLSGKGYHLSKKDTVFIEGLSIEKVDSSWVYFANANRKSQQGRVPFKLVDAAEDKLIFENTNHDFPQRFIYKFKNDSIIELLIEGEENGNFRRRKISYKRRS